MSTAAFAHSPERPEFVTLIAIYQFVTAGVLLLMSCLIPAALFPFVIFNVDQTEGVFAGLVIGTAALALFIGFAFASIVVGWGLLRMREWARLGAIVLAAFALIGFPIWTIVAILILVYMTSEEARFAFHPEEAPPKIITRTISTADPDISPQAVYKAEPPATTPSPTEETRPVVSSTAGAPANGDYETTPPSQETRRIDTAIPMPAPEDPAQATASLYDQEADVSDHYRRWKASLPQEPASIESTELVETVESPEPESEKTRPIHVEPVESEEVPGEPESLQEEEETSASAAEADAPLTASEQEITERIWGPAWAFEGRRDDDAERVDDQEADVSDHERRRRAEVDIGDTPDEPAEETVDSAEEEDAEGPDKRTE